MSENLDSDVSPGLARMFDVPAAGMQDAAMEAGVLRRIGRRRRLRRVVIGLGALAGIAIAAPSLTTGSFPSLVDANRLPYMSWNAPLDFIFASLGEGRVGAIAVAGALTVLGLAFARFLEDV